MKYDTRKTKRKPDYRNLTTVLEGGIAGRPVLFEFFLNDDLYAFLLGKEKLINENPEEYHLLRMMAYETAGYDYYTVLAGDTPINPIHIKTKETISLNAAGVINDRDSFGKFKWTDPKVYDTGRLDSLSGRMPEGMKLVPYGPGGVLENVVSLMGYDNLCYAVYDNPGLVADVCEKVGGILVEYYKLVSNRDDVAAVISNDDWGFNTQLMLSAKDMRKYIFPWHEEIVRIIHAAGKPAILHSCGNLGEVEEDIFKMGYDAKHSYEDNIEPVEKIYTRYRGRIAVLGGIDLDFICRATPDEVFERSKKMLGLAGNGYALGSGNSIPAYVPIENYMAMIATAYE
jgi:uroporphyrinogen decarboxylase